MARRNMADLVRQDTRQDTEARKEDAVGRGAEARTTQPAAAERVATVEAPEQRRAERMSERTPEREPYQQPRREPSPGRYGAYDGAPGGGTAADQAPGQAAPAPSPVPKYLRMQRMDGRIREDQYMELVRISKSLNRQKRGGERITPNTLVRIGIDLLLTQEHALAGATETEIRDRLLRHPAP
jgi:hypothetical protein